MFSVKPAAATISGVRVSWSPRSTPVPAKISSIATRPGMDPRR